MKKLISIILCISMLIVPFSVYAEDLQTNLKIIEQREEIPENETVEQTEIGITESQDEEWRRLALEKIRNKHGDSASPRSQASGLVNNGIYNIRNMDSGKYLNVHYGVDANGTNVYQWTYDGSTEQKFKLVYSSSTDSYKLYAMCSSNGTNRVIDVARNGSALASGQNVGIWTPVDNTAQQLQIEYLNHNYYVMRMKANTSMFIAVNGTSNGTGSGTSSTSAGNVYIDTYDVFRSQEWAFELVSHPTAVDPTGTLESVTSSSVSGWAWRSDDPSISVSIRISITNNSTGVQTTFITTADKYRADLASSYTNHGFYLDINWGAFPTATYTVCAYGVNATGELILLSGSPKTYSVTNESEKGELYLNVEYYSGLDVGKIHIYEFKPIQTDYYNIFTTGSTDTYGILYSSNGTQLAYNDDISNSYNYNFKIQYLLEEGNTYKIYVRGYSTNTSGAYTIKIESAFLDKLEELQNLAKNYSSVWNSFELTMQYIRRYNYNNTFWGLCAGEIDGDFVEYVSSADISLAEYFTMPLNFYWYAPNGDIIDVPHFAATYNAYSYESFDLLGNLFIPEDHINQMSGWAGDLKSLVTSILDVTNHSLDYDILYEKTQELICNDGNFSEPDLLADIDASNIRNIVYERNYNSFKDIFTEYYLNGGSNTRFSVFVGDLSNSEFYNNAINIMQDPIINLAWDLMHDYDDATITQQQYGAICQAFTDYIWQRKGAE